jgi:two-component system alkaline phosphatase synthesis response regulator PhoP
MGHKNFLKVLLVDDDTDILELLKYNLEKEGYLVKAVADSAVAVKTALKFLPDLIILDIMMPHPNGIEICKTLRQLKEFQNTYIFFLTAKSESYYHEAALDTGGDDYIEKVVGLRALTNKVTTVLKRSFTIRKSTCELRIGDITLHRKSNSVTIRQHQMELNKPEFELLFFLAQNPGKVITRENLLSNIWGSEIYLSNAAVDKYIHDLQRKLGSNVIQTISSDRYRFRA